MPQYFRLRTPLIAISDVDGKPTAVTIPQGAEVRIADLLQCGIGDPLEVLVEWYGKTLRVFLSDLRGFSMRGESEASRDAA